MKNKPTLRAKIISKVIHQPNPNSLTQTTVSANTDRAFQTATQALSVSARWRMNGKISEKDSVGGGSGKRDPTSPLKIRLLSRSDNVSRSLFLLLFLLDSAPPVQGNGRHTKPGFLWPAPRRLAAQPADRTFHQMPATVSLCFPRDILFKWFFSVFPPSADKHTNAHAVHTLKN